MPQQKQNPMEKPHIEKVVANIGVGEGGKDLNRAEKLLKKLTGKEPCRTTSKHKKPKWDLREGRPIGCKVTLRGEEAKEFLRRAFEAIDKTLSTKNFDQYGNFSFGIDEYIDFPNMKYDSKIGIKGMDICVALERPGYRIKKRTVKKSQLSQKERIKKEESIEFIKNKFGIDIKNS